MSKFLYAFFFAILMLPMLSEAQQANDRKVLFSKNVNEEVDEISSKVALSNETQLKLARFFAAQDSTERKVANRKKIKNFVEQKHNIRKSDLAILLTPLEFEDYQSIRKGKVSPFALAIKNRKQLGLNSIQIDLLLKKQHELELQPEHQNVNLETVDLSKILNADQIKTFELIGNYERGISITNQEWVSLINIKLVNTLDSPKLYNQILNYEIARMVARQSNNGTIKPSPVIPKPDLLIKKELLIGKSRVNKYADVISFRTQLNLSETQVNALLNKAIFETKISTLPTVIADSLDRSKKAKLLSVNTILSKTQFDLYLSLKNKNKALKSTSEYWSQLLKFDLARPADSTKLCQEIFEYKIKDLNDGDYLLITTSAEKINAVKKDRILSRPHILLKLDLFTNKLPKSDFADILSFRNQLSLNDTQIDSLMSQIVKSEIANIYPPTGPKISKAVSFRIRYDKIQHIINVRQFNAFLTLENKPKAEEKAVNDWLLIKEAKLTKGLDSSITSKELINYEVKFLVASEIVFLDKTEKNLLLKREVLAAKPDCLKKLDDFTKTTAEKNGLKKSLAW